MNLFCVKYVPFWISTWVIGRIMSKLYISLPSIYKFYIPRTFLLFKEDNFHFLGVPKSQQLFGRNQIRCQQKRKKVQNSITQFLSKVHDFFPDGFLLESFQTLKLWPFLLFDCFNKRTKLFATKLRKEIFLHKVLVASLSSLCFNWKRSLIQYSINST